jgi:CheY-like chemotaxis protein
MSNKRALIVDDSKIAQIRLRKLLERYDVDVDCVYSAEEALSYLAYKLPAVIFMDHLMKGMDGFEALKIIKSNPDTAVVPIIMYTAKAGDVYISQARALGAIDVLSKDVIQPSNLDKVLQGIKLSLRTSDTAKPDVHALPTTTPAAAEPLKQSALDTLRSQITKLLDIHVIKLQQEINDNNRLLMKRLFKELQDLKARKPTLPPPAPAAKPVAEPAPAAHRSDSHPGIWLASTMLLAILGLLSYQLYRTNRDQAVLQAGQMQLQTIIQNELQPLLAENTKLHAVAGEDKNLVNPKLLYDALSWSLSRNNQFAYGQQALDEKQQIILSELVRYLHAANFSGSILLQVHFGNFCVITNSNGESVLPKTDSAIVNCNLLAGQQRNFPVEDQQSTAFINFLLSSPPLQEGKIRIEMESHGLDTPLQTYPAATTVKTAGAWNKVAALNNRVTIAIISDTK